MTRMDRKLSQREKQNAQEITHASFINRKHNKPHITIEEEYWIKHLSEPYEGEETTVKQTDDEAI